LQSAARTWGCPGRPDHDDAFAELAQFLKDQGWGTHDVPFKIAAAIKALPEFNEMWPEYGMWHLNRQKSFTVIKRDDTGRFPAIQPVLLKHAKEESSLIDMRKATEAYIITHLDAMAS